MGFAKIVTVILMLIGSGIMIYSLFMLIRSASAQVIEGEIIDFVYHWTTRGFIRRQRIQYVYNGKKYFYDTKLATARRQSGPVKIKVGKNGKVYEAGSYILSSVLGLLCFVASIYLLFMMF